MSAVPAQDTRFGQRVLAAVDAALARWDFNDTPDYRQAAREWCLQRIANRIGSPAAERSNLQGWMFTDTEIERAATLAAGEIEHYPAWRDHGGFRNSATSWPSGREWRALLDDNE